MSADARLHHFTLGMARHGKSPKNRQMKLDSALKMVTSCAEADFCLFLVSVAF